MARWIMGDSFHPGGLALTSRLAQMTGINSGSRVLDGGSGRGTSSVHLAKTTGCHVVGVTLEDEGINAGYDLARREGVEGRVTFLQGDILQVDLEAGSFDVVVMECVLSTMPRKEAVLQRLHQVLRSGGVLGLTDVTVNGPLPPELEGILAVAGCLADARSLDGYRNLVEGQGFTLDGSRDLREVAASFLRDLKGRVLIAEVGSKLGRVPIPGDALSQVKRAVSGAQELVSRGILSYGLLIVHKRE